MNEQNLEQAPVKRRRYSASFKRQIVEACLAKEASVPQVALAHGLNANMVHRWIRKVQAHSLPTIGNAFVALPMASSEAAPSVPNHRPADGEAIHVEIPYRQQSLHIRWPVSQTDRCLALLRELLQ